MAPKMLTNQKVWSPNHQSSTYEIFLWWIMMQQWTFTTKKQCDVSCHPTQLEHINAQWKDKGLVSYNNNHDTNVLEKHVYHEHPNLQEMGTFSYKRLQKSKVKNKLQRRGKLSPLFKS